MRPRLSLPSPPLGLRSFSAQPLPPPRALGQFSLRAGRAVETGAPRQGEEGWGRGGRQGTAARSKLGHGCRRRACTHSRPRARPPARRRAAAMRGPSRNCWRRRAPRGPGRPQGLRGLGRPEPGHPPPVRRSVRRGPRAFGPGRRALAPSFRGLHCMWGAPFVPSAMAGGNCLGKRLSALI